MAVVERKHKRGITYWVATSVRGVKHWERSGTNKREAQQLDALRRREVKEGTFRPDRMTADITVKTFIERWLDTRTNRNAENDRRLLELHVLPVAWFAALPMGDVRPKHLLKLIAEIKAVGKLSEKSVSLVLDLVRVAFRDAVIGDTIETSPYVVPRGVLKRSGEKRTAYESHEAAKLLERPTELAWLAWNHVALYGGLRCGEICGLRWGDWDDAPRPLGALEVSRQYDGQPLKTERPRVVPVHPELKARLIIWRGQWEAIHCRAPNAADLIFPAPAGTAQTKSSAYKAWLRSCKAAEVKNRSVHSTRHTFITFARRGGAPTELVELVTHNPKGTIVDRYTTRAWEELCRVVLAVAYVDAPVDSENIDSTDTGSSSWTRTTANAGKYDESGESPTEGANRAPHGSSGPGLARAGVDASYPADAWLLSLVADRMLRRTA
jgi:integrase